MADFGALFSKNGSSVNRAEKLGNYKVTYLHYSKLVKSPYQYREFSQEDIDSIVDLITAAGSVLQPVLVRRVDADEYEIIAGHQRCEGIRYLVEKMGLEKYALVPCMITCMDDVDAELNVVVSNIRKVQTPYETLHQINVLRRQIKKYPERFPDLPQKGTVAERVALRMGMSRTVVSEYIKISNNIGERGMELFAKNEIDKSAAMELAGFSEEEQEDLIEKGILTYAEIKKYRKEKDDKAQEKMQTERGHETAAPGSVLEQETCATSRPTLRCIHLPEYGCFLTENEKRTPGNGTDCEKHCCWECPKHGSCRLECNASESRPEAVDLEDEAAKTESTPKAKREVIHCTMTSGGYTAFCAEVVQEYHRIRRENPKAKTCPVSTMARNYMVTRYEKVTVFHYTDDFSRYDFDVENARIDMEFASYVEKQQLNEHSVAQPQETDVIDGEYRECCGDAAETPVSAAGTQRKDIDVLKEMLEKEKTDLEECMKVDKVEPLPPGMIQKKKLLVGALASMLCELKDREEQKGESQPELPLFRNNDQRKEWLKNYKDWGLWYEDVHIGVKYYKYQFDNGAVLVAEVYHQPATRHTKEYDASYLHLIGGPEPPKGTYGIGKWAYHKTYCRQPNSETELIEFLKEIQKENTK